MIMLLIVSDLFKSVWYLIFPSVVFAQSVVKDSSAFCQATGFFVALGIEASGEQSHNEYRSTPPKIDCPTPDFATLIIAVHAALYVFRSNSAVSEAGLYRYRYIAYFCWVTFSLVAASLAFLNHANPYVSQGTFCYLPVRPFWYRLALSWVPRYLIFCTILGLYIAIYTYVKYKFRGIQVKLGAHDLEPQTSWTSSDDDEPPGADSLLEKQVTLSTPVLDAHGLVGSSEESCSPSNQANASPANCFMHTTPRGKSILGTAVSTEGSVWENYTFGASAALATLPRGATPPIGRLGESQTGGETGEASNGQVSEKGRGPSLSASTWRRIVGLVESLRDSHRVSSSAPGTDISAPSSEPQDLPSKADSHFRSPGMDLVTQSLQRRHIAIRRQLRYMFIYPAVYMLMWAIPFIGHCFNYSDHYSRYPIFAINTCVVVIIPLQCAIDCWLFAYREKPWRYMPGSRGTFWHSFAFWTHNQQGEAAGMATAGSSDDHLNPRSHVGKSDGSRLAYQRRESEMSRLRAMKMSRNDRRTSSHVSVARTNRDGDRNWREEKGRRRQDSIWLGTEGSEPDGRAHTIEEEDEDPCRYSLATDEQQPRMPSL